MQFDWKLGAHQNYSQLGPAPPKASLAYCHKKLVEQSDLLNFGEEKDEDPSWTQNKNYFFLPAQFSFFRFFLFLMNTQSQTERIQTFFLYTLSVSFSATQVRNTKQENKKQYHIFFLCLFFSLHAVQTKCISERFFTTYTYSLHMPRIFFYFFTVVKGFFILISLYPIFSCVLVVDMNSKLPIYCDDAALWFAQLDDYFGAHNCISFIMVCLLL